MLALSNAYYKWASFPGRNNGLRVVLVDQQDAVSSHDPLEGNPQRLFERTLVILFDIFYKIQQYLRIGITFKLVSLIDQLLFYRSIILDDAVVDHRNVATC